MEYYKSITQEDLIALIVKTKRSLFLCLPSLHEEIEDALGFLDHTAHHNNFEVAIYILIDFDAQTFRQGYGNYPAVDRMIKDGYDIKTLKDNRISFIISDDIGYYLFIESRSLIPAEKETINAVKIDPVSLVRLKHYFFSDTMQKEIEDELTNAIIQESKLLEKSNALLQENRANVNIISEDKRKSVDNDLKQNPPVHPDHKRIVDFYSNKFQYVRLKFEGSNLKDYKIELPAKALPLKDDALKRRLETKLNLFDPEKAKTTFAALLAMKTKVDATREIFLVKVKSREESLLNKEQQNSFDKTIEMFKMELEDTKQKTLSSISDQILEAKSRLIIELRDFLIDNAMDIFPNLEYLWKNDPEQLKQIAHSESEDIVHKKIKWPKPHQLVNKFDLIIQYSDITFQDLKNEKFVKELHEAGLINDANANELAVFSKGIKIKNNN